MQEGMHDKSTRRLKYRIVLLATVAITTFSLLTYIIVHTYDDLLGAVDILSKPNSKLSLSHKLMTDLSLAENALRSYSLSKEKSDYQKFDNTVGQIQSDIDSLIFNSRNSSPAIDSISILLTDQVKRLQEFVNSVSYPSMAFTERAINQLDRHPPDSITSSVYTQIKSTTKHVIDSVVVMPSDPYDRKAKGIFKKLKALLKKTEPVQVDTLTSVATNSLTINDTTTFMRNDSIILNMVKGILLEARQQELLAIENQKNKELRFIEKNTAIIDEIRTIITRLEQEEKSLTSARKSDARTLVDASLNIINVIVFVLAIAFTIILILIFADISKSKFYQNRLERAKDRAERLAQVKQRFLANMSHEIRTPLTAIVGYSDMLSDKATQKPNYKVIEILQSASKHLLSIVNDILDISKLESTGITIKPTSFDLKELLKESCDTFQFIAEQKGIKLMFEQKEVESVFVQGDEVRLKQVIYNLLDNALKFTEEGYVKLSLKSIEIGTVVESYVEVSDTGIGIDEGHLKHIFTDFYQSDVSHSKSYSGTGLGLAIVKKLVRLHGGDIQVRSTKGSGSTFSVFLPLQKGEETIESSKHGVNAALDLENVSILVVDDDHFNLSLLSEILGANGVIADFVESANLALQMLRKADYDLVISDIHMPDTDGIAFLKQLREFNQDIPVIALTANVTDTFKEYGFAATVTKPINQRELLHIIGETMHLTQRISATSHAHMSNHPLYDLSDIYIFTEEDPQSIKAVLEAFIETLKGDMQLIGNHLNENDWEALAERAHKMVAPCGQLHIVRMTDILRKLESKAWNNVQEAEHWVGNILNIGNAIIEDLEEEIKKLPIAA